MLRQTSLHLNLCLTAMLTALLLTACSDSDDLAPEPTPRDITQCFDAQGKAWLNVQVGMDEGARTRAANGSFSQGNDAEHAVGSALLVLFRGAAGTAEDDLTVASMYAFSPSYAAGSGQTEWQSEAATVQISNENLKEGDDLYLLVILNAQPDIAPHATFSRVKRMVLADVGNLTDGLVMTNAPVASLPGGEHDPSAATVTTLTKVPTANIKRNETDAAKVSPIEVWVERAAVKMTVADGLSTHAVASNTALTFTTADLSFAVDNYNTSFYLTRQFSSTWLGYNAASKGYRFVEASPYLTDGACYRTCWAEDINYAAEATDLHHYTSLGDVVWQSLGNAQYCAENTFDVAHATNRNATSVLVRLRLNGGVEFYTISDTGDKIYTEAEKDAWLTAHPASTATYYKDGYCYYRLPIEHFGKELTPWTLTTAMTTTTPASFYGNSDADYLGRYGCLRNTLYEVIIDKVAHVGTPDLPSLTDDAVDAIVTIDE